MKMEQSVPKRRHIKFGRQGITQKKAYNIQNTAKVWNQEVKAVYRNNHSLLWKQGRTYTIQTAREKGLFNAHASGNTATTVPVTLRNVLRRKPQVGYSEWKTSNCVFSACCSAFIRGFNDYKEYRACLVPPAPKI